MAQAVGGLGLVFALVFVFVGVGVVDSLESVAASVTSGSVQQFIRGLSFYTLLLAIVVALASIGAFAMYAMKH